MEGFSGWKKMDGRHGLLEKVMTICGITKVVLSKVKHCHLTPGEFALRTETQSQKNRAVTSWATK